MDASVKAFEFIRAAHAEGRSVIISTYTKDTRYEPKHASMIKLDSMGNLLVQNGKRWDCIAHRSMCLVKITAEA